MTHPDILQYYYMLISDVNKELPNCPFLYDKSTSQTYCVLYSNKIKLNDSLKLKNMIAKYLDLNDNFAEYDCYVNVQFVDDIEKEIYVSYHTWLILALNPNIKIIPQGINISANFYSGLFPIYSTLKEAYKGNLQCVKTCDANRLIRQGVGINKMTYEYAKITNLNKKLELLPANSCNFILKTDDYPVNSFISVIKNPTIYVTEKYVTHMKQIKKSAITLHITIEKSNLRNITEIIAYINSAFGLNIDCPVERK